MHAVEKFLSKTTPETRLVASQIAQKLNVSLQCVQNQLRRLRLSGAYTLLESVTGRRGFIRIRINPDKLGTRRVRGRKKRTHSHLNLSKHIHISPLSNPPKSKSKEVNTAVVEHVLTPHIKNKATAYGIKPETLRAHRGTPEQLERKLIYLCSYLDDGRNRAGVKNKDALCRAYLSGRFVLRHTPAHKIKTAVSEKQQPALGVLVRPLSAVTPQGDKKMEMSSGNWVPRGTGSTRDNDAEIKALYAECEKAIKYQMSSVEYLIAKLERRGVDTYLLKKQRIA